MQRSRFSTVHALYTPNLAGAEKADSNVCRYGDSIMKMCATANEEGVLLLDFEQFMDMWGHLQGDERWHQMPSTAEPESPEGSPELSAALEGLGGFQLSPENSLQLSFAAQ